MGIKKCINKFLETIIVWISKNKLEFALLLIILLIGSVLRLYKISEYMTFLGDEGRDAIIVRRLWTDFDLMLIGPRTSIGNMYLGPLYYYLIAPSLLLAGFSPVGPSIFVAILGVATIFLVWFITREWFERGVKGNGFKAGALVAALLYAVSPTIITFSRSSWNPNVMPFFALICIYSIWKVWQKAEYKWLIVLGISFAFVMQSHYLGLLILPVVGLFYSLKAINLKIKGKVNEFSSFKKISFISLFLFSLLMSPLLLFDMRHGWINFSSISKFFLERQTTVSARPWTAIPKLESIILETNASLLGAKNVDLTWLYTYGIAILLGFILWKLVNTKKRKAILPFIVTIVWLLVAYLGLGVYKQHIYDHYFGFFFPAPFILVGGIITQLYSRSNIYIKGFLSLFIIYAVIVNVQNNPLKYHPNKQMQRAMEVAEKIQIEAKGEKMNLAVLAERNYEDGYQYFLEKWREPVFDIDPLNYEQSIADQLFVVCELPKEKCDPTHSAKAEVANFGWSEVDGQWDVSGITLYKLVHTEQ